MSYKELYKTINKPWASVKEIMLIANCGRDTAIKIRNTVADSIKKKGYLLPNGKTILVPTKNVIKMLNLDLEYMLKMAREEMGATTYASVSK